MSSREARSHQSVDRGDDAGGLSERLEAVRRRAWPMAIAFALVLAAAAAGALFWPATYRSMGTILIEQQEVPIEYVRSTVRSYADERVQVISQHVMTTSNLLGIIDKYQLYAEQRSTATREQLVGRMHDDVQLDMISADVMDPREGATEATIAFAVGFESQSPELAMRVANDLVTLFMQKNIETRQQLAAGTTEFLSGEAERLRVGIAEIEQRIAEFKGRNYERLPEFSQTNAHMLSTAQSDVRELDGRIQALNQQISFLDSQLGQLDPRRPAVNETGQALLSPAERLRAVREQYVGDLALYTPRHPSLASLKREIYGLELQAGGGSAATAILDELEQGYTQLAEARAREPVDAADVQRLEKRIGDLVAQLRNMPIRADYGSASETVDNPAYLSIQAQRQNAITERSVLSARRGQLAARIANLEQRQLETPGVERDFSALQRELQAEQTKYGDVRQKLLEAQLAQNLETEQKGERFTLIEPPLLPQEPVRPNRPAIFALGLLGALALAVGLMLLLEVLDTRIRGRRQVVSLVGAPPLAIIPWVAEERESRRFGLWRRPAAASAAGA
jgi:uncharacterized protein involved in exopolysaccharide biosynthesis